MKLSGGDNYLEHYPLVRFEDLATARRDELGDEMNLFTYPGTGLYLFAYIVGYI